MYMFNYVTAKVLVVTFPGASSLRMTTASGNVFAHVKYLSFRLHEVEIFTGLLIEYQHYY